MMFIDTGAFIARYDRSDSLHRIAAAAFATIQTDRVRCLTSSFVVSETLTFIERAAGGVFAARVGNLLHSSTLAIVDPEKADQKAALSLLEKYADQHVSYCDCVSFVVMRRLRVKTAFSFDKHFERAGFQLWPSS